jgi:hypothetical protein
MNKMTFINLGLYAILGVILQSAGVGLFDKPFYFLGITTLVVIIDILSFTDALQRN